MASYTFFKCKFTLTEQTAEISADPEQYQQWLDRLSINRPQLCAEELLKSMEIFNNMDIEVTNRQKLLLLYLQKIKKIYPSLQVEMERTEGLGHEITRRAASVMVRLYTALFHGLRIMLVQRIKKPPLLNREQNRIELLSRVLQAAKEVMITCGRFHVVVPANIWLYCHEICRFAQEEKLLDKPYKGVTLNELYIHLLLVGMIPHSRMNADSFDWLRQHLFSCASSVNILTLDEHSEKPNGFYFDVTADHPPRFFPRPPMADAMLWRKVDCQKIIAAFSKTIEGKDAEGKAYNDDVMLLRLVTIEWSYSARRRCPRDKVQEPSWFQSRMGSVWELLRTQWQPGDVLVGGRFTTHPCLMTKIDTSDMGCGLTGDPQGVSIQIGEIAVVRSEMDACWKLGVIRWVMLNGNGQNINCGLEFLTNNATAVEVRPVIGSGNAYFTPALQLPANPKQGKGSVLVLTGRVFSRLREFIVRYQDGTERAVRLSRLSSQTSFYQFAEFLDSEDL